jgi:hypothetical protein
MKVNHLTPNNSWTALFTGDQFVGLQQCEAARPVSGQGAQSHDIGSSCGHCAEFEKFYVCS